MSVAIRGNVALRGNVWTGNNNIAEINSFIQTTGATDTAGLIALATYISKQGLWSSVRLFPFKAAQNIGTGNTVYGLGGWTSNNITLIGASLPTWSTDGITFNAVDNRGTWNATGIETLRDLYFFDIQRPVAASMADAQIFGVLSFGLNSDSRILLANHSTSVLNGETTSFGLTLPGPTYRKAGSSTFTWSAGEKTQMTTQFSASVGGLWKSKTAITLDKTTGTQSFSPVDASYVTDSILNLNTFLGTAPSGYQGFVATTRVALLCCKVPLTTTQRETITDLLGAL